MKNTAKQPEVKLSDETLIVTLTLGQLLAAIADAVSKPLDNSPLTTEQVCELRPVTPGWLRSHVTACGRGARQRLLYRLPDVDAALAESPVIPRPRKCTDDVDEIDELVASGALVRR